MTNPRIIPDGWLKGSRIRCAKKAHRCDYHPGGCGGTIMPGDFYAEGDPNEHAGGFGNDRYCLTCAGEEARRFAQGLPT